MPTKKARRKSKASRATGKRKVGAQIDAQEISR